MMPNEPGWWWYRLSVNHKIEICEVIRDVGDLRFWVIGWDRPLYPKEYKIFQWLGKAEPPQ